MATTTKGAASATKGAASATNGNGNGKGAKFAYAANGNMGQPGLQLRYRGATQQAYKAPLAQLRAWAKGNATNTALVAVLTHTGWFNGGTVANRTSNSSACTAIVTAVKGGALPGALHTVGQPVGPQLAGAMQALHTAGAPTQALNALWACYTGKPKPPTA